MSKDSVYAKARKFFEQLDIGVKLSAQELAENIGASTHEDRKKVAAFLSQQATKGRVKKYVREDKRVQYEKITPTAKPSAAKIASVKHTSKDMITLGEVGESIVSYIERLETEIEKLEKQRAKREERLSAYSKQKEEFKRLYQEAEAKIRELSKQQPS
jgi:uncharacterized protein involved in exopolysaccharide biosynthesis